MIQIAFSPAFSLGDEGLGWNVSVFCSERPAEEALWGELMPAGGRSGTDEIGAGECGVVLSNLDMKKLLKLEVYCYGLETTGILAAV